MITKQELDEMTAKKPCGKPLGIYDMQKSVK